MPNNTDLTVYVRKADLETHKNHPALAFELALPVEGADVVELQTPGHPADIEEMLVLGIPFYGSHGSFQGDYPAQRFAYDGRTFWYQTCAEDDKLSLAGDGAAEYLDAENRVKALMRGAPAPANTNHK